MNAASAPPVCSIGVVGAGAVGQAVAMALVAAGLCEQLIIASRTLEQARSMVADLDDMRLALACPHIHTPPRQLVFTTVRWWSSPLEHGSLMPRTPTFAWVA